MKKLMNWIGLCVALGVWSVPAAAQNCLTITSPFSEVFEIGITGSADDKYSLSLERQTFTTRTASGAALLTPTAWYFTWGYTYPGGTLGWQCEVDPITGIGTGALTQIFTDSTFNQTVDCAVGSCLAQFGSGRDSEQP